MRWIVLGVLVLSACARSQAEDAALAPPIPAAQVRASPRGEIDALAGYVTAHEGGVLKLDSGGPTPIELRLDPKARVTRDGRSAGAAEIVPGDVVRAAVRSGDDGQRVALQVFANSRPVSIVPQNPARPAQQPQARSSAPLRR